METNEFAAQHSHTSSSDGKDVTENVESVKAPEKSTKYIQYNGISTRRVISRDEWEAIPLAYGGPVTDQDTVEWSGQNRFRIPVSELSKEAVNYLLKVDGRFEIVSE